MSNDDAKGWYSRGYLPHRDELHLVQSLTFRLVDSIPQSKLRELDEELRHLPPARQDVEKRKKMEYWLDQGMGCCALRHPAMAGVVRDALYHHGGTLYRLIAWCVMPNHVHALIHQSAPLGKIIQSWKSFTGSWASQNHETYGFAIPQEGFWQREYWDRYMRDANHLENTIRYIHENPVQAGLCRRPADWAWSSAAG